MASDFANSLLIRFRKTNTTMKKSHLTMLLLSLKMTSPLECPTVHSDPVTFEPTNSQNAVTQQTTNIHLEGTLMHQTSSMTILTPVSIQIKIPSKLQKMTCAMRLKLLMKRQHVRNMA